MEGLISRGLEVIYMTEPIDEYSISHLREYQGYPLVSIVKEGLDLCESEDEKKHREELERKFEKLCKCMKGFLHKHIDKVFVSTRLVTSPCCILASQHSMSGNMERISRAQTLRSHPTKDIFGSKKQFEINPNNSIIIRLRDLVEKDVNEKSARDLTMVLFETALLQSGFALEDPSIHTDRIYRMIMLGLGIDDSDVDKKLEKEQEKIKSIKIEEIEKNSGDLLEID